MYYLRLNAASPRPHYWCQRTQAWTQDPREATIFASRDAAHDELERADTPDGPEVEVCTRREEIAA